MLGNYRCQRICRSCDNVSKREEKRAPCPSKDLIHAPIGLGRRPRRASIGEPPMQWSSVCLVRSNAAALGPKATSFADEFIDRFVRECPELSRALTWDREERRRSLLDTFAAVIRQAGHSQSLAARLIVISASNERRGVRRQHYNLGREILLEMLAEYNG